MGCAAAIRRGRPYRWVRHPIHIAALLVLVTEACLFLSLPPLVSVVLAGIGCTCSSWCMRSRHCRNASASRTACTDATLGVDPACASIARVLMLNRKNQAEHARDGCGTAPVVR